MTIFSTVSDHLFGRKASLKWLMLASALLLFTLLGARDIWTQEHRWADIVSGMFFRQDFLHPYLGENNYYDKPLLSYWLIVIAAKIMGGLSTFALRLPSALSGMLAIWSLYKIGEVLKNKTFGLVAGWILLTTFYFVFWARTSSADMLNLAGTLAALAWYFTKREKPAFFDFVIFFVIVALTSLCKGLIGAVVPFIAVATDVMMRGALRQYLRPSVFLAAMPALLIYVAPFVASSYFSTETYHQNGLYLVYRENILRYFQPFDHQGPIYTYFLYLPIYLFPWALFFIPALLSLPKRWKKLSFASKWMVVALTAEFLFFTLSGSRRSYYVLPMVPFAILVTADWLFAEETRVKWRHLTSICLAVTFLLLMLVVDLVPAWYYQKVGVSRFATILKTEAQKTHPWSDWKIEMLDAESKLNFYLNLPPNTPNLQIKGTSRAEQTNDSLLKAWPILNNKPTKTIFITRLRYLPLIKEQFAGYKVVKIDSEILNRKGADAPVAFIPEG